MAGLAKRTAADEGAAGQDFTPLAALLRLL
jgi:hypothetical protein